MARPGPGHRVAMKRTVHKKLSLHRDTIRNLSERALESIGGARPPRPSEGGGGVTNCYACTYNGGCSESACLTFTGC
jgi:hypothetical protein